MSSQNLQMTLRGEAFGFSGLRSEVQREHPARLRLDERVQQFRHEQVRDDRGEPGARTEDDPVGVEDRRDGFRDRGRVVRHQVHGLHLAGRERHVRLAAHGVDLLGPVRVVALDQRLQLQGYRGHGQHAPVGAQELADQVERLDVIAELLPEGDDQEVADRVLVQVALGLEAVLDDAGPGLAPVVVAAQRGERLAQVAGRQHAQLVAQTPAGAAVVGHGDDGGEVAGDPAESGERGGQAHAAAEGDHLGLGAAAARPGAAGLDGPARAGLGHDPAQPAQPGRTFRHSRPMSRCTTTVSTPSAARRAASFSDVATERCLPPVQPIAMVTYRLPSRR